MTPKFIGIATLIAAMGVESFAQLFLKVGAAGGPEILRPAFRRLAYRYRPSTSATSWLVIGVLFYSLEIFLYTLVLHRLDVSIAFPMGSLCFVGVALLSRISLGESVGTVRWLGILGILLGTVLMAL